jgi:hypothetical protein
MIETKTSPPTTCFFPTKDLMPRNWHEIIAQLKFKTRDFGGFPWVFRFSVQCSMVFPWFSPKKTIVIVCYCYPMGFPHGFSTLPAVPWARHMSVSACMGNVSSWCARIITWASAASPSVQVAVRGGSGVPQVTMGIHNVRPPNDSWIGGT